MFKRSIKKIVNNVDYNKDKMFECDYNGHLFLIKKMNVRVKSSIIICNEKWQRINSYVLPAVVHYKAETKNEFIPYDFFSLNKIITDRIKVLVVVGKKANVFIKQKEPKQLLPEDRVNNVHICHIDNLKDFINNYNKYNEGNEHKIIFA